MVFSNQTRSKPSSTIKFNTLVDGNGGNNQQSSNATNKNVKKVKLPCILLKKGLA